jgi:hypothetical protein
MDHDYEKMKALAKDLRELVMKHNIVIITTTQAYPDRPRRSTSMPVEYPEIIFFDYVDVPWRPR